MKLMLQEPFRTLWAGKDAFAAVEALSGKVYRAMPGRRTLRVEIEGEGYFVKIHQGVGWREICKNLAQGRLPVLGAGQEWRALSRLQSAGVPTMTVLAFGEQGLNPARRRSFIITQEIAPAMDLEAYTQPWRESPPAPAEKRALISEVARMTRQMHQAGVNHRDCYICHFLRQDAPVPSKPTEKTAPRLFLIDLHRAQVRASVPRRWRDKDLAGLYFSALEIGLTRLDRLYFLRAYFAKPLAALFRQEASTLVWLEREAARLQARQQKYGGRL
ncbi:MAG: lipopolysaccharide core heptose(I) kinase RfaP [Zoogloeaceae bacterium]|jgi:heptose I phosphotransferase|nr:lipopolysaccharide core heptose(I) kinase RfaP [Zoogloeaceae bacterium]